MEDIARIIWRKNKDKLPEHQRMHSKWIIKLAGRYACCWICGDDENLFIVTIMRGNTTINGIMCVDCLLIQKLMGANIVDEKPLEV